VATRVGKLRHISTTRIFYAVNVLSVATVRNYYYTSSSSSSVR